MREETGSLIINSITGLSYIAIAMFQSILIFTNFSVHNQTLPNTTIRAMRFHVNL